MTVLLCLLSPKIYSGQFSVLVRASDLDTSRILPGAGVYLQPQAVNLEILTNEQSLILSDTVLSEVNRRLESKFPGFSYSPSAYAPESIKNLYSFLGSIKKIFPADKVEPESIYQKNDSLREFIEPSPVIGSHTIEVVTTFYDPVMLKHIQQILLEVYLSTRGLLVTTEDTLEIYERDVSKFHKQWMALQDKKTNFQIKNNLYNITKQKQEMVDSLIVLDKEITSVGNQIKELQRQLEYVRNVKDIFGLGLTMASENQALTELENQITLLEVQRGKLLSDYLPSSQPVKRINYAISELTKRYTETLCNTLASKIIELSNKHDTLKERKKQTLGILNHIEDKSGTMVDLEKKTELAAQAYQTYSSKLQEVKLQKLLSASSGQSLSILRDPYVNSKYIWPNMIVLFPLALVLGLFFGITGAWVYYSFEDIVLQPSDLAFTGVSVAGTFADKS